MNDNDTLQYLTKMRDNCAQATGVLLLWSISYFIYSLIPIVNIEDPIYSYRNPNPEQKNYLMGYIILGFAIFMALPTGLYAAQIFFFKRKLERIDNQKAG